MKSAMPTVKHTEDGELLKILGEDTPVGMCIMQDGKFCYVNSTFPIAIGYTVDELVGKGSLEIVAPEDREKVSQNTIRMLKGELASPYQFRVIRKDGGVVWIMATVKSIQYHGKRAILGSYMEVTERKQAEERIQESEARYRLLAENMEDVIWTVDVACPTRLTYISPSVTRLLGYSVEESMTTEMKAVFTPASFDIAMKAFAEEMASEQKEQRGRHRSRRLELQLGHKNGSLVDVEVNFSLIHGTNERRGEILAVARDITERKQAEHARREAEEEKGVLLEEAPVSIAHTDLKGRITYVNQRFESESGYSREEVIGKSVFRVDWFAAGTLKFLAERMDARLRGNSAKHWEAQFKCKNEQQIWIELEGKILKRSGVPVGFQIIATNITERKQAEEALSQSEERYRTILEEMGDGYFETDLAGNLTFANDALISLLGYQREEITGMNFRALRPKEEGNAVFKAYNRMYRTGEPLHNFPSEIICKDGRHVFAETSAFPIRNDKGEIIGFRGVRHDISERKKAEEALRESEERYRRMFEEALDAILIGDAETDILLDCNRAACELVDRERSELIGKHQRILHPPETIEGDFSKSFGEHLRAKEGEIIETQVITKGGEVKDVAIKASVFEFRGKKVIQAIFRDVTQRRQTEQALRQSEERYRTMLEEMEDAYSEVDLNGHLTFVNNSVCRDLGYSREELVGMSYKKFAAEDDIESLFAVFNEVYRTGSPNKGFSWKTIRKDRTRGFAESSISPIRSDKGEIIGFRSVGRDVSERKKMEEKLRQSEENYKTLFDSSVIGTIVLHAETLRMVMANQAAAKMFGFSSIEEIRRQDPFAFIHPEDREETLELTRRSLAKQNSHQTRTLRAITRDGRQIWLSATAARITHDGKLAGLISFADVTEQKLQNDKLMIADRLVSIGELAAGAAHELNNPLASIIGLSELLMEKNTPNYIRSDLAMIRDEARRAANVTSNLLTFARKHRPVKQLTQINAIIEDVLKLRAYAHKSNCIEVVRHLASDLPEILADPFQMQQVFLNIVINAEYFMMQAHNRGTLTVTTKRQNGGMVVAFTDDGTGISPENLSRIFDPFFTTKEAGKGTGLGLSICHGIVAAHGGQIYVRSQLGQGATISIELPINGSSHAEVIP